MSIRTHTCDDLSWIAVTSYQSGRDRAFVDTFGPEWSDTTGPILAIEDTGNGEAFLLIGTPAKLLDFATRVVEAVSGLDPTVVTAVMTSRETLG